MRWYSRSSSAPSIPRPLGLKCRSLRKGSGALLSMSPVAQYFCQSTQGLALKATARSPPRQRAVSAWTFPWKRSTRSSATWRNPFHATRPQDAKSSGLLAQPAKKSIATMMKLWTSGLGSKGERRIIDLSHLRRFSPSGEIDNGGCAESLIFLIRENHVGCLFRDHVNRCDDEKSWNPWEHRGVNDPQPLGPVDSEITVEHRHRILLSADLASAGGVVAPGIIFYELGQALSLIGIG